MPAGDVMRLKALLGGTILIFAVTGSLFITGGDPQVFLLRHLVAYLIVGAGFGLYSPERGWRLGLWLVAPWLAIQIITVPLAQPSDFPRDAEQFFTNLLENMMVVVAACFGAAVGAIIGRHYRPAH